MRRIAIPGLLALVPRPALSHASDQSFVLLLPTDIYISAGAAVVALTVLILLVVPDKLKVRPVAEPMPVPEAGRIPTATSLLSLALLAVLLAIGLTGPRDPLSNLMPLLFWTVWWAGLVSLSGLFVRPWRYLNPWTGLYRLIGPAPRRPLPERLGMWPAVFLLIAFAAFLLADIAPDDPARLAVFVAVYWAVTMAGLLVCGPSWLDHCELGRAIFGTYGKMIGGIMPIRAPRLPYLAPQPPATGIFALTLLAVGSFDGLNETFWWLGFIGVNPLEFPGRSAVIWQTIAGLVATLALLFAAFGTAVWLGLGLVRSDMPFRETYGRLALSLVPIALAYHIAHYLPSFLVNIQYTWAALSDPFGTGADYLGLGDFHVTTGFFNRLDTVRVIWLTQAGIVVLGHVLSVLVSHQLAKELFGGGRGGARATLPLSVFMIGYTFLGLWLLAAPKGA